MLEKPNVIPLTVVAAVLIFIAREILEAHRRRAANKRKIAAIKNQLASECERTNWSICWLRQAIKDVRSALDGGNPVEIQTTPIGIRRLFFPSADGDSSSPVPKALSGALDKYLFEVASLDADLFRRMIEALSGVAELNHILDSLVEYVEEKGQPWLEGWCHNASREVGGSEETLLYLYEACTGQPLIKARLR